jgi:hypothetical protein
MRRTALFKLFGVFGMCLFGCTDDGSSGDDEVADEGEGDGLIDDPSCQENWFELDGPVAEYQAIQPEHFSAQLTSSVALDFYPAQAEPAGEPAEDPSFETPLAEVLDFASFVDAHAKPVEGGWWIETDQFVTSQRLEALYDDYVERNIPASPDAKPKPSLMAYNIANTDLVWSGGRKLELTWCLGRVFPKPLNPGLQEQHDKNVDRIVRSIEKAARAWERAGDINFIHLHEYDSPEKDGSGDCQPGENGIYFRVRMDPECKGGCFGEANATPDTEFALEWASPDNPEGLKREFVFGFASLYSDFQAGITAHHELGHVLRFAHEHLRWDQERSGCSKIPAGFEWRGVTPADPKSVMGYPWCKGIQNNRPWLSAYDRLGAYYQYSWGHRRPLMMAGGSPSADYAYDGSDRTSLLWYQPRASRMALWVSAGDPDKPIEFEVTSRCLDGSNPPCDTNPDSHGLFRPSPLLGTGTQDDLDVLMLAPGPAIADSMLFNDGNAFDAALPPFDFYFAHPVVGAFGAALDDQVLLYVPGPPQDPLLVFSDGDISSLALDFPDYSIPLAGRYRGFEGGGNDIVWYQPEKNQVDIWQWLDLGEFEHLDQGDADGDSWGLQQGADYVPLVGDFNGDDQTDLFWYAAGEAADWLWLSVSTEFVVIFEAYEVAVDGEYKPFVGDFDGNGVHDLFWYSVADEREGGPSVLWYFDEDGGHDTKMSVIHRDYSPYPADFDGDGCTDILWYRADSPTSESPLWRCQPETRTFGCDEPVSHPENGYPIGYGGAY